MTDAQFAWTGNIKIYIKILLGIKTRFEYFHLLINYFNFIK